MSLSREVLDDRDVDERLRVALRSRGGRATESDMIVTSGLAPHLLGPSLRRIMLAHECAIETTADGDVVYVFDPALTEREDDPWRRWRAIRRAAWAGFRAAFKVAIAVALVAYFVIVVALVIAAMVALASRGSDSSSSRSSWSGSSSSSSSGDFFLWAWLFGSSDYRAHRRHYRQYHSYEDAFYNGAPALRYESPRWATDAGQRSAELKLPFYKRVFAFVFGREGEERDQLFTEKQLLAYIRSAGGVVSPTELSIRTGWSLRAAEKQSTRLIAAYGGDVEVDDDGQILYVFPELMATAGAAEAAETRPAPLIWEHYELPQPLTGNSAGANTAIALLNGSVLLGALVLIPHFAAPVLGIDMTAPAAHIGLYVVPAVYSALFFLIPVYRALFQVGPENRRRARRNSQRALLEQVYARSLPSARPLHLTAADLRLPSGVKASIDTDQEVAEALQELAVEYGADGTVQDDGRVVYTFERIAAERAAASQARLLGGNLDVVRIGDRVAAQLRS
ncbi:MAG: hypothetical protein Tsb0020_32050 [Haliangiales bacterium]